MNNHQPERRIAKTPHGRGNADRPGIVAGRKCNPGVVTWAHSDFFPIDTAFYVVPKGDDHKLPFLFYALIAQDLPSVPAGSAAPDLNRNLAYMNQQLVPDIMTLDAFSSYANAIFERRHRLEEESRALAAQRDALLPRLVSGGDKNTGDLLIMTMGTDNTRVDQLWGEGTIRVFISHKAEDKVLANDIKNSFLTYHVASFVAHEDIEPMMEWQIEIERALFSMDLLVALLTPKFNESNWTDQEIGVAIGRKVPVVPIRLGKDPYGFIGRYQAIQEANASKIVDKIIEYLIRHERIDGRLKGLAEQALDSSVTIHSSVDRASVLTRVSSEIDKASPELGMALKDAFSSESAQFDLEKIFDTLLRQDGVSDSLKGLAKDAYISAVTDAGSFAIANRLARYLPEIETLSIPQAELLMKAFNENDEVRFAFDFAPVIAGHLGRMTGNNFALENPTESNRKLIRFPF